MSLAFLITRHGHLAGVRLSLLGSFGFGNMPFEDDAAAVTEAETIAAGRQYTIERRSYRALPSFRGATS